MANIANSKELPLKYTIKQLVQQLDYGKRGSVIKRMAIETGNHANHIRRIWNYTLDSHNEIKMEDLITFAKILNVSVAELIHEDLREQMVERYSNFIQLLEEE